MAEKIDKDECISRVYQFLNKQKDWKSSADKNGDGVVIKAEFRSYLLGSNFSFKNGENKEDIIETFWKSIDVNSKGTVGGGSQVSNKNALDSKEMQSIQNNIEATQKVLDYFTKNNISAPKGLDSKYQTSWKESVKAGVLNKVLEFLKSNSIDKLTDEMMAKFCKTSSIKATADYKATEQIEKQLVSQFGNIGYKAGSDDVLDGIIEKYISGLSGEESDSAVMSDITKIVNAYVTVAKDGNNSSAIGILSQFGFDATEINPLQEAVWTNNFKNAVIGMINQDFYAAYKTGIDTMIEQYAQAILKSGYDYGTLSLSKNINALAGDFVASKLSAVQDNFVELSSLRDSLISSVTDQLQNSSNSAERKAVVKKVFGSDQLSAVINIINGYDKATINSKKLEFDREISAIETNAANSALGNLPSAISGWQGVAISPIMLSSSINSYTVKLSNSSCPITISSNKVDVNSDKAGNWTTNVQLYDKSGKLATSKSVTLTLRENKFDRSHVMNDTNKISIEGKSYSISELINKNLRDANVTLSGFTNFNTAKAASLAKIKGITASIYNSLSSTYPPETLKKAINTLNNYYEAVFNSINEYGKHDGTHSFEMNYKNELDGTNSRETVTVAHGWAYNHKNIDDIGNVRKESGCDPSTGIYVGYCNGWGYTVLLDLSIMAKNLISFMPL